MNSKKVWHSPRVNVGEMPPPKQNSRAFVEDARRHGMVQYVAFAGPRIVGWCDVVPHRWEGFRHAGRLGMGIAPEFHMMGLLLSE